MKNTTVVSSKYQITLPSAIRKLAGFSAGDRLAYQVKGGEVRICKVESLQDASRRISNYIKPGTTPLNDASAFYQTRSPRL